MCKDLSDLISGEIDSIRVELNDNDELQLMVDGKLCCDIPSNSDHYVYNDDELLKYFQDSDLISVELCGNELYFMYDTEIIEELEHIPNSILVNARCIALPLVWEA